MAKAYLGKISALVTANTSDFNSKLNASAKEVRSFAASMQSSLSRAQSNATASLRGIYTESQNVSRALQAVATQRLSFKGFDRSAVGSIREAVDQFRALQAASVAVNEPLSNAARTVERLSASVQQSFDPALKSAQKSAEYLDAALKRGGIVGEQSFERIRQRAIAAAEAADRLAEASQLASGGPRGRELAFAAPRVRDALSASADVRQRAANAPAVALEGGRVSSDVQKLVAIDNLIQKRRAEIESGTILNIDTTRARASLENLLAVAKRVRDQINSAIGGETDAENATLINRARAQREFYEESERLAKQAATDEVALIARRTNAQRESSEERTRLERQAAEDEVALIARRVNAQREGYEERTRLERQAAEDAATLLIRQARAQQEFEEERRRRDAVAASDAANEVAPAINRSRAQRESAIDFGLDLDAPRRQIEVLRGSIVSLKGQLDTLPAGVRAQFIPAILAAQQNLEALAATPAATTAELAGAAREVDRLTQALGRARQAANIPSFRQFARDLSTRQAIGELQALQQVLARVGAQAGGPAAQAYNRYAAALRRATREGTTELPATRRELERLQVAAAQAAAATGRISFRAALREIRRGGDIARGGFDNLSLAVNQAAFAIDDFFSATGGLEFKLRAVSNNITQLAFILGGTRGLFLGLAAVIGGQLAVALVKFINGGRTAEDQTKALNDALSRQKSLVEELAQAFQSLGDSLTRNAFSPASQEANAFKKELDAIVKKQKELRDARAADVDPTVARERATQGALQRQLDSETNIGRRIALQQEIDQSRRRERDAAAAAAARPAASNAEAAAAIGRAGQALFQARARAFGSGPGEPRQPNPLADRALAEAERRAGVARGAQGPQAVRDELIRQRDELIASGQARDNPQVARAIQELESLIRSLELPIQKSTDALAVSILEGSQGTAKALARAQSFLSEASFPQSRLAAEADAAANRLKSIADQITPETDQAKLELLRQEQEALQRQVVAIEAASRSLASFTAVLDRQAAALAKTVESELASAEESQRRNANRLEAQFGRNDPRVIEARDNEQRLADQRRRAERQRLEIEQKIEREQARFESGLLNGVGNPADIERARRIRQLDAQANSFVLTEGERRARRQEADRLRLEQQQSFESRPDIQRLRRQADQGDIEAQRELQRQESVARGRQLAMTPGQRAAEELDQQITDIREYFSQAVENSSGLPADVDKLRGQMNESIKRAQEDMMRQVAPTIMGMADARENAILQGPSRAALNVNDVATMQGQQELNRLLRGDDAAKNVDLVNLQREANRLLEAIKNKENPVA